MGCHKRVFCTFNQFFPTTGKVLWLKPPFPNRYMVAGKDFSFLFLTWPCLHPSCVLVIRIFPKLKGKVESVRGWGTNLAYIIATFSHWPCTGEGRFLSLFCSLLIFFLASLYLPAVLISLTVLEKTGKMVSALCFPQITHLHCPDFLSTDDFLFLSWFCPFSVFLKCGGKADQ